MESSETPEPGLSPDAQAPALRLSPALARVPVPRDSHTGGPAAPSAPRQPDPPPALISSAQSAIASQVEALRQTSSSTGMLPLTVSLGALAAVASYQTVAAVINNVRASIDRLDSLNDLSERLGVSAKALQEIGHAGVFADASIESIGKGLQKLSQNMVEANDASSKQAALFRALGVATADAEGNLRDSADVMTDLAGYFEGVEDGAVKTALAIKLFGKQGVDLIPLLNGGKEGLKAAREALVDVVDFVAGNTKASPNAVFAGSVPYLMLAGNVVAGWQMARALLAAEDMLARSEDAAFMNAKIATARFYADHLLSKAPGIRDSIVEGADSVTALALEAF